MEFEQLIEMPRFYLEYGIKFFNDSNKEKIVSMFEECILNDGVIFEVTYQEENTYSFSIKFDDALFCGFSCTKAILYLFTDEIVEKFAYIIENHKSEIKEIDFQIYCYDNALSKRYYMHTDIEGTAAIIIHKLKPNLYFDMGKDGIGSIVTLQKDCKKYLNLDIYNCKDWNELLEQLKYKIKQLLIDKKENYKKIIIAKYAKIFIKKLISKKIQFKHDK